MTYDPSNADSWNVRRIVSHPFRVCGISLTLDGGTAVGEGGVSSSAGSASVFSGSHSSSALRGLEGSASPTGTDVYMVKLIRAMITRGINVKPPRM